MANGLPVDFPEFSPENNSLLKKYLTAEVFDALKSKKTENGFDLTRMIRSGLLNPDSAIGVYAGDAESYRLFSALLDPIIETYHQTRIPETHPGDFTPIETNELNPDPDGIYIRSTRIRVGRNLDGFPLGPAISTAQRNEVESLARKAFSELRGPLAGTYRSLKEITPEERTSLTASHILFKEGDRFLEAAGLNRDWPDGRGIFFNEEKTVIVWINEEDQFRIISMEQTGNLLSVYNRLAEIVGILESRLTFLFNENRGYLTSCPTNLGTAMRASVHIRLPELGKDETALKQAAAKLNLQVRGIHGEHSESIGGVFDISNKRRLGISEKTCIQDLSDGVAELIRLEKSAVKSE